MKNPIRAASMLGWTLTLLVSVVPMASAGLNGGGAIVVHTNDSYNYSVGTVCTTTLGLPAECAAAITRSDKVQPANATIWFLAAFDASANPVVASVYFGTDVDDLYFDAGPNFGFCGPSGTQQVPDSGWPYDAGCWVSFPAPVVGNRLFPFYFFAVQNYDDDPSPPNPWWCAATNPTGGYAAYYDDAFPPNQDSITRFGCVKFYESGSVTCPVPPPTGACCVTVAEQAVCQIVGSKNECDALSGVYQGDNTVCDAPCSACCYWDGDPVLRYCVVTTAEDCANGVWSQVIIPDGWGHNVGSSWAWVPLDATVGIACATEPPPAQTNRWFCQDPRDFNPPGACCYPDGACGLATLFWCETAGGIYHGDGSWCEPYPCTPPQGACCQSVGTCTFVSESECLSPGIWQGAGSVCSPNPCLTGACCLAGYCLRIGEAECAGYVGVYLGNATSCTPNPCPMVGACCQSDGSCRLTLQASCGSSTNWLGGGTTCSPNPCAIGACCAEDGTCLLNFQTECLPPGVWRGVGEVCNPNPCPPGGTCCSQDGSCLVSTQTNCDSPSVWQSGTPVCTPNPCPPGGACCGLDGTCVVLTQASCVPPRTWQSGGSTCAPNPCPPVGACCQPDGTCTAALEVNCSTTAIWQGADTVCNPNPCTTGACCLAAYCLRCTQTECGNYGGVYEGNGHLCDPNPCLTSAADQTSQKPARLTLSAAPVPSSGETSILYQLPASTAVTVEVFDASGALVRRLAEGLRQAGSFVTRWDGRDDNGRELPGGVFFVRIVTEDGSATGRVVLAK